MSPSQLSRLPLPLTPLVGRECEVNDIEALLCQSRVRMLTLTGPGGVGKTRLAIASAERLLPAFNDVAFVPLAGLSDYALVVPTITAALGISETPDTESLDRLAAAIADQRLLLIIDNVEHVMGAATAFGELLARCPNLTVLATSRMPLHLYGELEYPVLPLGLPLATAPLSPADLTDSPAATLFVERVRASQPSFVVTIANVAAIAAICQRLDGLPLAIELAAARAKAFPPATLLARLEHPLSLLTGGPRDAPTRQQTLRNTIAWSYDLLDAREQALFRRLAVFAGGITIAAAEAACTGLDNEPSDMTDGLTSLLETNLIGLRPPATDEPDDAPRFGMLETIREFGLECIPPDERDETQRRHASYFLDWMERVSRDWNGPAQLTWLRRADIEIDNVRTALAWAVDHDPDLALRLNRATFYYWVVRGYFSEGRRWFDVVLGSAAPVAESTRADALCSAGFLATTQSDYAAAQALTEESLALYQQMNDRHGVGAALHGLARIAMFEGDFPQADWLYQQSNQLARDLGNLAQLQAGLGNLGSVAFALGDIDRAIICVDEALALVRAAGDLGGIALQTADRALLAVDQEDWELARSLLAESLTAQQSVAESRIVAQTMEACAWLAASNGQPCEAPRLLGIADRLRESCGVEVPPSIQADYDTHVPAIQEQLGLESWRTAWAEGRAMSFDRSISYALEVVQHSPIADVSSEAVASPATLLSGRELEVIRLLADGRSNQDIAAELFISPHTAAKHVANIMNKLGLDSRTAVATYALRQGLV